MRNTCFAQLSEKEKSDRLSKIIFQMTDGELDHNSIRKIVGQLDCTQQYSIEITTNPNAFVKMITLKSFLQTGPDKNRSTIESGEKLIGCFSFGSNAEKCFEKYAKGKVIKGNLSDITKPAVTLIHTENTGYDDLSLPLAEDKILIYLPQHMMYEKAG